MPASPLPVPGETLAEKYLVERTIGEGGMGVVFQATHLRLKSRVAIKVLRPEFRDAESVARFEREARAASSLTSPHVCRISDVGALADGTPFMVMELLEGEDLGTLGERRGATPLSEAVGYLLQASEAMDEAHSKGIIHRDLKPENLFLVHDDRGGSTIKVLDFGISKKLEEGAVSVTRTQSSIGTPLYMSPEQTRSSKHVDVRTDVWSMGVILYELITAQVPFSGLTPGQVAVAVALDKVVPARSYNADLPPAIDDVISTALQKDPDDRFPTIRAFAMAILPFAAAGTDTSRWTSIPGVPFERPSSQGRRRADALDVATTQTAPPPVLVSRRRRLLGMLAALAALGATAGAAGFFATRHDSEPRAPTEGGDASSVVNAERVPEMRSQASQTATVEILAIVTPAPAIQSSATGSVSASARVAGAAPAKPSVSSSAKPVAKPVAAPTPTALPTRL